jgi:hypothetical protein
MLRSASNQQQHYPERMAFGGEQSGSVTVLGARRASGSCPAGCMAKVGLWWWRQTMPHHPLEDPDVKTYRYAAHHSIGGLAAR